MQHNLQCLSNIIKYIREKRSIDTEFLKGGPITNAVGKTINITIHPRRRRSKVRQMQSWRRPLPGTGLSPALAAAKYLGRSKKQQVNVLTKEERLQGT